MSIFKTFYNQHGIRNSAHIRDTVFNQPINMDLPHDIMIHYLNFDKVMVGPPVEGGVLGKALDESRVYMQNIETLTTKTGAKAFDKSLYLKEKRTYFRTNRELLAIKGNVAAIKGRHTIVYNYYPLALYQYQQSNLAKYHKYANIIRTLVSKINDSEDLYREHIIHVDLPEELDKEWFTKPLHRNTDIVKHIRDGDDLFALSVHQLINGDTGLLDTIDKDILGHVTIMFKTERGVVVLNVGMLAEEQPDELTQGLNPLRLNASSRESVIANIIASAVVVKDKSIKPDKDNEEVEPVEELPLLNLEGDTDERVYFKPVDADTVVLDKLEKALASGTIDKAQRTRLKNKAMNNEVINPITGKPLSDIPKIKDDDISLKKNKATFPKNRMILDESMLESTVESFDKTYNGIMPIHKAQVINAFKKSGNVISDYRIERDTTAVNDKETHIISITPIGGKQSTIRLPVPIVKDNGTYMSNGSIYRMRKQKIELPIRKINNYQVATTTYYSKLFISRSKLAVDNNGLWIFNQLTKLSFDSNEKTVISPIRTFRNRIETPMVYARCSLYFNSVTRNGFTLIFDVDKRKENFPKLDLAKVEKNGMVVGIHKGNPIIVKDDDKFYTTNSGKETLLGDIYDVINLDRNKAPKDLAVVKVTGKDIPVFVLIGFLIGLSNLIKLLKVKVEVIKGRRKAPENVKLVAKFSDSTLFVTDGDKQAMLILQALNKYAKVIKDYPISYFDEEDVYSVLLETKGLGGRFTKEFTLMNDMYIDPITESILLKMGEPTTFVPLIMRGVELLTKEQHPDAVDGRYMRIRGYERIPGTMYKEVVKAIRKERVQLNVKRKVIELGHHETYSAIVGDNSNKIIEDINPIQDLKEKESVTFSGDSGRDKSTMTIKDRLFHTNDVGMISEAVTDSGDVGINTYLSANPQFDTIYGDNVSEVDNVYDNPTASFSTSYLLSPLSDKDDGKRANFSQIQNSHVTNIVGAETGYVMSGYEYVMAHRVGHNYANMAPQNGKVLDVDKRAITVKFNDGSAKKYELGYNYGNAEGTVYTHELITQLHKGDRFKTQEAITYNPAFFEPSVMADGALAYKHAKMLKVAIHEGAETFEDSCVLSERAAKNFTTVKAYPRIVSLTFDQEIHEVLKEGDTVDEDTPLLIIEDATTGKSIFNEETINALKSVTSSSPTAEHSGFVGRVEVFYNGEIKDMSSTLQTITKRSDKEMQARTAISGTGVKGNVGGEYMIKGKPIDQETLVIKFYIIGNNSAGGADKVIFGNQLKTTIGRKVDKPMVTVNGIETDASFGLRSSAARIVNNLIDTGLVAMYLNRLPIWLFNQYKK